MNLEFAWQFLRNCREKQALTKKSTIFCRCESYKRLYLVEVISTIPSRRDTINKHREKGGSVAAVLPIHYPRALLRAFDLLPVEVWGPPGVSTSYGSAHLQPYVCSIVHNALSFLHTGGLDVTDFIFVPHACDSLQGLGSILIDFVAPRQPIFPIYIPRGRQESAVDYLADELRSIYHRLEAITGRSPSNAELMKCIQREEAADQLLSELHQNRQSIPLTDDAFYRLIRSREYLPAETFVKLAQEAQPLVGATSRQGIPILLSGILPEPMSILEAFSEIGALVVADDLACCGRRLYPPGNSDEPFHRMAERILKGPPDPTRGDSLKERLEHLLRLVDASGARGVVFYVVKFCEPELFDLPILRKELGEANVPSLIVEVDINDQLSHRVLTRLAAFLETIQ